MEYIKLLAGFILLIYSGNFLVKGGVALAKNFNVSTLVIGVTVVSMGTSLPELFVSAQAALDGYPEMAMGNVIGSNIANIALVLGLTAIIFPMVVKRATLYFDTPFMIGTSLLFYFFILDYKLQLFEGILFTGILVYFVFHTFKKASENKEEVMDEETGSVNYPLWKSIVIILISSVGLKFGAEWLVTGAVFIAEQFHVSETIISVTLIAFGTSVPELATSVIAAIKKQPDISVGNIVGSNIFNILAVLGISSIIKEISISDKSILGFHIYWMLGIAVLLFISLLPVFKIKVSRLKGIIYFVSYISYIWLMLKFES